MARAVRATIRYGSDFAEVIRCIPIHGPVPQSNLSINNRSDGAWIEVVTADGEVVHRQALPDPFAGREEFGDEGKIARQDEPAEENFISLELPWPGDGAQLKVHARKGRREALKMAPGTSLVAKLPLQPRPVQAELGAVSPPPPTIRQLWGASNAKAMTLAFFAEGFTAPELPLFHQVVGRCVTAFQATPPFKNHLSSLRVAEVATVSRTSGIHGHEPGDTVFKGRFQKGSLDRVILVDQVVASQMLDVCFPRSAVCLVVANTSKYGGSGGAATVFSCEPDWAAEIAIHELGHTLFGLADEYDAAGQARTMDPVEPNVCGSAVRAKLKWADLVAANTPLPTQRRDGPVPAGTPIGAYEGAKYQPSSVYRAEYDCKMRTPGQPFCSVCRRVIEERLNLYAP